MSETTKGAHFSRRGLLLASAVGVGVPAVLASCNGGDSEDTNGDRDLGGVDPLEIGADIEGPVYKDGYIGPRATEKEPFGDAEQTFKIVVPQDSAVVGDWNRNKATEWIEERTGVKVEFQAVLITGSDGSTDMTRINAMLSGGDLPDAFMGIPFTQAQVSLYGQQGLFQPLDDLIEVYAPELRKAMEDYPDLRALRASTDGNMHMFPGVNDCFHCKSSEGRAWINTEYLEDIGAQMPTTTEELRQVLNEFKDRNPSGESGFIPLAAGAQNPLDNFFMQPFLYSAPGNQNGGWLRLNGGNVEFTPNLPEWREALKYLRQLGDDGLITEQTFAMTNEELQAAGNRGSIGFARAYWWGSFFNPVTLDSDAPWRAYEPVPPLAGPDGTRRAMWNYYNFPAPHGLQITRECENPEILVQWADTQMDLQSIMWTYDGVFEDNWFWSEQGAEGIDGEQALWRDVQWPPPEGQSWSQFGVMYRSSDYRTGQEIDPDAPSYEAGLFAAGQAYEEFAQPQEEQLAPVIIGESDAAQAADTATSIDQHVKQSIARFSLGQSDINSDSDWEEYVEAFNAMNIQAYLDIYQRAHDERPS